MKILWVSHLVPYPPKGGVLQRSYNLVAELSKYWDVHLIAFAQGALLRSHFGSVERGLCEARKALTEKCCSVEFVLIPEEQRIFGRYRTALRSLFTRQPYTLNWLSSSEFGGKLAALLEYNTYDVVHFDTISLAPYRKLVAESVVTLDHHNIESHLLLRRAAQELNPIKSYYYKQEGRRVQKVEEEWCGKFDINLTCSELDSERLKSIAPKANISAVPNGVDLNYFKPVRELEHAYRIVFAGMLGWGPNRDAVEFIAQEIWPLLKERCAAVCVDIVGSQPPDSISHIAKKDENFIVHGYVEDVREYISRATVYVCPIRDGGGTKLKILDAFAMGKAVVAHPVACEGIDVVDGENVLLAWQPSEFVRKIIYLFESEKERVRLGTAARTLVEEKYDYCSIGAGLSKLLSSQVNASRGGVVDLP